MLIYEKAGFREKRDLSERKKEKYTFRRKRYCFGGKSLLQNICMEIIIIREEADMADGCGRIKDSEKENGYEKK